MVKEVIIGSWGQEIKTIWTEYPLMNYFITDYEKNWRAFNHYSKLQEYWWFPLPIIVFYLTLNLYIVPNLMKNRKGYDLKLPLAIWNFALSIFSFMGVFRTFPYLYWYQSTMSFRELTCTNPMYNVMESDIGLWYTLFGISKGFELFDTLFITLRKKPLIFLHWYHHATVFMFCYYAGVLGHNGLFFTAMNFFVHSWMYLYYALMAFKMKPIWFKPQVLTFLQILQMAVGSTSGAVGIYYKFYDGKPCDGVSETLLFMGLIMYSSYFYLFAEFAYKRFVVKPAAALEKKSVLDSTKSKGGEGEKSVLAKQDKIQSIGSDQNASTAVGSGSGNDVYVNDDVSLKKVQ